MTTSNALWMPSPSCLDDFLTGKVKNSAPMIGQDGPIADCMRYCEFDSIAFGFAYWRLFAPESPKVEPALAALPVGHAVVEARVAAAESDIIARLERLGFRKACMQFNLTHSLEEKPPVLGDVNLTDRLDLSDAVIRRHAENFTRDRVSLEPEFPESGRIRFYSQWISNSLALGTHHIASTGPNFVSFKTGPESASVDLVSVLDKSRGIGGRLNAAVIAQAASSGARLLKIGTLCENPQAWRLYQALGFKPESFAQIMYMVRK